MNVFVDKSYFLPISWDHTNLAKGVSLLKAAIATVSAFPGVSGQEGVPQLLELANLIVQVRFLVQCEKWDQLLALLDGLTIPSHMVHDEVVMARQEYLTGALEEATRSLDQAVLKKCLAMATGAGMLPCEKPVYQALQVFIDPPEYVINLPKELKPGTPYELGPDADGQIVLTVKVRGSQNLHWTKNGIALKEGADGGRIKGVETPVLTITKMLGRDEGMKLQCIAKNKFGTVKSNEVKVRLTAAALSSAAVEVATPPDAPPPPPGEGGDDDDAPGVRISLTDPQAFQGEI